MILFEPSTSEHISARTIFDPITSLAPASDCQTYAIGSVGMLPRLVTLLMWRQISERFDIDRGAATGLYDLAYIDDISSPITDCQSSMACILNQAKVGYVGNADLGRGSAGVECFQAAHGRVTKDDPNFEKK